MRREIFNLKFSGIINHAFLIAVSDILYSSLSPLLGPKKFKSVFFITNEMVQNIYFYSGCERKDEEGKESASGTLSIRKREDTIEIITTNCVNKVNSEIISRKLDHYNSLTEEELKALKKQILKGEADEGSKGGGIGLIEVIRKAQNPMQYHFESKNDSDLILNLKISINTGENNG